MIDVRDVYVRFDQREVLGGVSLHVDAGETLVIMGASGGGKSTLLRCIAGLLKPTSGTVDVDKIAVISDPETARGKIGFVFQSAALFDFLNVSDNILFGVRRFKKLNRREGSELVARMLALVGLKDSEQLMPSELSGGMRKRVGLARALASEPKIVLYDEPTSGLDPITAYAIDQLIVETQRSLGVTSIVVSHDINSILRVAERVAFLDNGQIAYDGPSAGILDASNPDLAKMVERSRAVSLAAT